MNIPVIDLARLLNGRPLGLALISLLLAAPAFAVEPSREAQVAAIIAKYADAPPQLRVLLQPMPKGGDLHNHLDGSVYAEDYLKWASDDGDCIARATRTITPPPCDSDQVPAKDLVSRDPKFYQETIDALSMRNFVPGLGTGEVNGHDHTFATFGRFGAVAAQHLTEMMLATRDIAAADNVQYIEQIADPPQAFLPALLGSRPTFDPNDLAADLRALAPTLPDLTAKAAKDFDEAVFGADRCDAVVVTIGCSVRAHYLYFVLRTLPPDAVFAQMALGFSLAASDPNFVGIDLVGPEDDPVALRDFELQMNMFQFFHRRYPDVKLSLHAGELALGLVPPTELGFHIRGTVEIAGAQRIGHGYSIPYERDAASLLREMVQKRVAVEINLTSNDITPGIRGAEHPLAMYRKAGVPVTLSADDEGVFRIDLTHEYVRAVTEQKLGYLELKEIARNGLEYSFVPGPSLWQNGDYRKPVAACAGILLGTVAPAAPCAAFLAGSEKAALQRKFEADIAAYEDAILAGPFAHH